MDVHMQAWNTAAHVRPVPNTARPPIAPDARNAMPSVQFCPAFVDHVVARNNCRATDMSDRCKYVK